MRNPSQYLVSMVTAVIYVMSYVMYDVVISYVVFFCGLLPETILN